MTLVREYQPTFVLGDGETKEFSYLFEEVSENFIKVIVKHSDDSTYTPVFSVDLDSHKVVFGESETAPLDTDVVCIYRETPDLQDTPFRTLQGYDAKALENILSKIVAMIQELKANGFSTQILQGTPWQLDLLHPTDDNASVVVDYNARILKKGLYFQIVSGNLQVSADGSSFIAMPKSADITEFRRLETVLEDLTVQYRLQYKVDGVWYNAESNAEATADEALQVAQDAKDIAQGASDKVDTFDDRLTIAEGDASDAKQDAIDAKELAEDTAETVSGFDNRITQAEQNATDAKSIAQTTSGNLTTHTSDMNNPHQVTKAQIGLGNVDNTSDLNKPVSTATQNFVNSSIATSTATFRGTYNSLAELEAVTADENDYGFVVAIDSAGNTVYNRYKYTTATTPASWVYEYALNNSSFTAIQWASINSGVTTNDVSLARSAVQPSDVGNGTITITQGGTTKGTFTTNQGGNTTIDLDAGGSGLPDQTGNAGKFLTTDGTDASWGTTLTETLYLTGNNTQEKIIFNWGNNSSNNIICRATDYSLLFGYRNGGTFRQEFVFDWLYKSFHPINWQSSDVVTLGTSDYKWSNVYTKKINNGADIEIPNQAGTMVVADPTGATQGQVLTLDSNLEPQWATQSVDLHRVIAFQAPTADNNYTWYRLYADGWVEMGGGSIDISYQTAINITLPITMADTNYTIMISQCSVSSSYAEATLLGGTPVSTTQIRVTSRASSTAFDNTKFYWQVSGMSAS